MARGPGRTSGKTILTFAKALESASKTPPHLVLGNGFSIALFPQIFQYGALFDQADFSILVGPGRKIFDALGTRDFEAVIHGLRTSARVLKVYAPNRVLLRRSMLRDARRLREILVRTIAGNHPEHPDWVPRNAYIACRKFLSNFKSYYTLNYDLLLYWTIMQADLEPAIHADDGFRTPEDGPDGYVTWDEGADSQNLFYLHGALHLFDAGIELRKFTWINTGIRLMEQIHQALKAGLFPLVVTEGEAEAKRERIMHNAYLHRGLRSFRRIGGTLFIFGHSLHSSDAHILRAIARNRRLRDVFVSIYGDPDSPSNRRLQADGKRLEAESDGRIRVAFYDAESAEVWGPAHTLSDA